MNSFIRQITVDQLQVGMFITEGNNNWVPDKNFSRQGLVTRSEVIEQIRALGVESLYIDTSKGKDCEPQTQSNTSDQQNGKKASSKQQQTSQLPAPKVSVSQEMENAKKIQQEATALIGRCMADIKVGKVIDVAPVTDMASDMVESLTQNHNALTCVTQLREKDRYLMEHSFNVSVLMGILASSMGYKGNTLEEIVTGALLHDIGKIRIDDKVLHKPGKLTDDEWVEMKNHVTYGEDVLSNSKGISQIIIDICAQHHERLDGSGYPRGLSADEIPIHSRMAAIVDVYDAITADRVYHKGMAPTQALKKLMEWSSEGQLDQQLIYQFIQAIGVYPAGTVVELDNQKLAIVTEANPSEQNKPKVLQMYDLRLRRYDNRYAIDLADERCGRHIVKAVYPSTYKIKLSDFV
ncbi:MAG: HD-GYP domain-containing protein [Cellvibrionaceae bacterium]